VVLEHDQVVNPSVRSALRGPQRPGRPGLQTGEGENCNSSETGHRPLSPLPAALAACGGRAGSFLSRWSPDGGTSACMYRNYPLSFGGAGYLGARIAAERDRKPQARGHA